MRVWMGGRMVVVFRGAWRTMGKKLETAVLGYTTFSFIPASRPLMTNSIG